MESLIRYFALIIMLFAQIAIPQTISKSVDPEKNSIFNISRADLITGDRLGIIDKGLLNHGDSIRTCFWREYYWIVLRLAKRKPNGKSDLQLFAYSKKWKQTHQVTRSSIYLSGGTFDIKFYDTLMFVLGISYVNDPVGHRELLFINSNNLTVLKDIHLLKSAGFSLKTKEYVKDNTLHIQVQPKVRELNVEYYFLFWLPRGRSPKWKDKEVGNIICCDIDKNLNVVKEEEIKPDIK